VFAFLNGNDPGLEPKEEVEIVEELLILSLNG